MRFTQEQRDKRDHRYYLRRQNLLKSVYGKIFEPYVECEKCKFVAFDIKTIEERMKNFVCPKCGDLLGMRYFLKLHGGNTLKVTLLGRGEVIETLPGATRVLNLRICYAALFWSALFHFGSLRYAFEAAEIKYHETSTGFDLKKVSRAYLGKLPDTEIAKCTSVTARKVSRLRKLGKIAPFKMSDLDN